MWELKCFSILPLTLNTPSPTLSGDPAIHPSVHPKHLFLPVTHTRCVQFLLSTLSVKETPPNAAIATAIATISVIYYSYFLALNLRGYPGLEALVVVPFVVSKLLNFVSYTYLICFHDDTFSSFGFLICKIHYNFN